MQVNMLCTLALFVLSFTSQVEGEYTNESITYLQLRGGLRMQTKYLGRVVFQINNEGVDGAICGTWTRENAIVACRMLGYSDGHSVVYDALYGRGNHNFLMSNLRCNGQEPSLSDCTRDSTVNCQFDSLDVVVSCSAPANPMETFTNNYVVG